MLTNYFLFYHLIHKLSVTNKTLRHFIQAFHPFNVVAIFFVIGYYIFCYFVVLVVVLFFGFFPYFIWLWLNHYFSILRPRTKWFTPNVDMWKRVYILDYFYDYPMNFSKKDTQSNRCTNKGIKGCNMAD